MIVKYLFSHVKEVFNLFVEDNYSHETKENSRNRLKNTLVKTLGHTADMSLLVVCPGANVPNTATTIITCKGGSLSDNWRGCFLSKTMHNDEYRDC